MKKIITKGILLLLLIIVGIKNVSAISGIDVSEWQGSIDFEKVKNDNIEIVYIRSSAGNSYKDANFEENYKKAKSVGLNIGFYHYVTARTIEEAKEQAIFFASVIAGKEADCRLAMDFEALSGLSKTEVNAIAEAFLKETAELTQKELVIYSDAYNARDVFDNSLFNTYPLWVAEYEVEKPEADNWIGWQYSDQGKINGINGNVDLDEFKENIYLNDKSAIKQPEIPDENKTKVIYYQVKLGDNLTKIAKEYQVTVNDLLKWNSIINPNLIFPNEIIRINTNYDYTVTSSGNNTIYIVKKGNTLTKIANLYHVTINNLVTWNQIKNPNLIYPGEEITIKKGNNDHTLKYIVKEGDTLTKIASDYKISIYELTKINHIKDPNKINKGEILYIPEAYILEK